MVDGRLRVAVTAPPVDGEANAAVIDAVAKAFGVRRSAVTIAHGERGRRKTLAVEGADAQALETLLRAGGVTSGISGIRSRRQPASSGTTTWPTMCRSGSSRITQPPGRRARA